MSKRALFLVLLGGTAYAQPQQEVLTLEKAIEIAERVQPVLAQSRASVEAALGRVDASRVARKPTVTLAASASTGSTPPRPCADDMTMTCGGFFDATYGAFGRAGSSLATMYSSRPRHSSVSSGLRSTPFFMSYTENSPLYHLAGSRCC